MILPITILVLIGVLAGLSWRLASRRLERRRKRLNLLAIEWRLGDSMEMFRGEVLKLKHYRVLRPTGVGRNTEFIPSTNMSSLRYIKGRQK